MSELTDFKENAKRMMEARPNDSWAIEIAETAIRLADEVERLREASGNLRKSLEFYANPYSYFGIGFLTDEPCGEFALDFSKTELGMKPGALARDELEGKGR